MSTTALNSIYTVYFKTKTRHVQATHICLRGALGLNRAERAFLREHAGWPAHIGVRWARASPVKAVDEPLTVNIEEILHLNGRNPVKFVEVYIKSVAAEYCSYVLQRRP